MIAPHITPKFTLRPTVPYTTGRLHIRQAAAPCNGAVIRHAHL